MGLSIQGRLTAWYTSALLAALTLCGLGLYASVLRLEISSVDDDLQRAASTAAFGMNAEVAEGLDLPAAAKDTEGELRIPGIAVGILDADGQLLAAQWEGFDRTALRPSDLSPGSRTLRTRSGDWRALVTYQTYRGNPYLIVNALPLAAVRHHSRLIGTAFLAIMPITLAVAVGGGWLLSRSTLRPVLESQRRFMADASHELRTPVSVIRSAADVTLSRPERSSAEYRESIGVIAEQAARLTRLVEDLFLLARADVKGRPLSTSRFYLDDVLAECVRAAEVLGGSKDVHVDISTEKDVEIEADEDLVRRMLLNLLENAVRHTCPGTAVRVEMKRDAGHVTVSVADHGPGVPEDARERIFERFVRLETGHSAGAGLGLAIARWIAEAHGGSLKLAESSPKGSLFVMHLPASASAAS